MPDLDRDPGDYRERPRRSGWRWLWTSLKIWGAGVIAYALVLFVASGNLVNTVALIAALVVVGLGYTDESIKRLWARKADKRQDLWDE